MPSGEESVSPAESTASVELLEEFAPTKAAATTRRPRLSTTTRPPVATRVPSERTPILKRPCGVLKIAEEPVQTPATKRARLSSGVHVHDADADTKPPTTTTSASSSATDPTPTSYLVGTPVWAKVNKNDPWWPARISYHPTTGQFQNKTKLHVQFLGPVRSHGWAPKLLVTPLDRVSIEDVRSACASGATTSDALLLYFQLLGSKAKQLVQIEQAYVEWTQGPEDEDEDEANAEKAQKKKNDDNKKARGSACWLCCRMGSDVECLGCHQDFHSACLGMITAPLNNQFKCDRCSTQEPVCLHCTQATFAIAVFSGDRSVRTCEHKGCGQAFHEDCALAYTAAQPGSSSTSFVCPLHRCTSCLKTVQASKLVRCLRCPTIFHKECVPVGSVHHDAHLVTCGRHLERKISKNLEYCVICSDEGELMCCDGCVAAVHPRCMKVDKAPEGKWMCLDCHVRPFPSYGAVAMVKFGSYRMWPVLVHSSTTMPDWIGDRSHQPSDVVVEFLGSKQFSWVSAITVLPFNETLLSKPQTSPKSTMERQYTEGMQAAKSLILARPKLEDTVTSAPVFGKLKKNEYVPPCRPIKIPMEKDSVTCLCSNYSEHCGSDSQCLNRLSLIECTKYCEDPQCENKRLQQQNKLKQNVELFHTGSKGWGVRTLKDMEEGDLVVEYVGEVIDGKTCGERLKQSDEQGVSHYYFLLLDKDTVLDASRKGNVARFINHSCDPNCETQKWIVDGLPRIGIYARKDIAKGTELSFDYKYEAMVDKRQPCFCGTSVCSGFIGERKEKKTATASATSSAASKKKGRVGRPRKQSAV